MSDEIIDRVHCITERQRYPDGLTFTRVDETPVPIDDDNDHDFVEANDEQANE